MIDFLTSFAEIYFYPWNPENLNLAENYIMQVLLVVFVVSGIVTLWRRVWYKLF